ncbi:MAG: S8 family peptidase [Bdellovibrionota bacterium]
MQSLKLTFGIAIFFSLFLGGLALMYSMDGQLDSGEFSSLIKSNKKMKLSNRDFEVSEITSKVGKVEDEPSALFNDPAISQAWGLKKSDAARAWSITKGNRKLVAAIIDTGIDEKHEDLKVNLWVNAGETGLDKSGKDKATNGIDDDGNGFIDDVNGWNFVSNNNKLTDNHGHGTHIAGIIGAEAGNGKGIIGIAPEVSLMVLKYYDPTVTNSDNLKNTVKAIHYAIKMGATVINYSGGGTEYSQEEFDAVQEAEKKGILLVAAAGNERSNSDQFHYYPADYKLSNLISVTALDPSLEVLSSSNYGVETVDLAAPGQNILSTLPGNTYGFLTGTSQATAFVTGAAILIMAKKPAFKFQDVKKHILATGDVFSGLAAKTRSSRKLNLYKCLTILDEGVAASGIMANTNTEQKFNSANAQFGLGGKGASSNLSPFGKDLLEAVKKPKNDKLGAKPADGFQ